MAASRKSRSIFPWKKQSISWRNWDTYGLPPKGMFVDEDPWWALTGIPKELKLVDGANGTVTPNTGLVYLINGIATGDEMNTRDGRKVNIMSIHILGHQICSATSNLPGIVYVALVYDKRPGAAVPAFSDMFSLFPSGTIPFINPSNRERFSVLWCAKGAIGPYTLVAPLMADSTAWQYEAFIDLTEDSVTTVFSGTGATIASISHGAIYAAVICGANNVTTSSIFTRVRFTE